MDYVIPFFPLSKLSNRSPSFFLRAEGRPFPLFFDTPPGLLFRKRRGLFLFFKLVERVPSFCPTTPKARSTRERLVGYPSTRTKRSPFFFFFLPVVGHQCPSSQKDQRLPPPCRQEKKEVFSPDFRVTAPIPPFESRASAREEGDRAVSLPSVKEMGWYPFFLCSSLRGPIGCLFPSSYEHDHRLLGRALWVKGESSLSPFLSSPDHLICIRKDPSSPSSSTNKERSFRAPFF